MKTSVRVRGWLCAGAAAGWLAAAGCASLDAGAPDPAAGDLESAIVQRLAMDPVTRSGVFGVDASGGQVTVRGTVRSEIERMRVLGLIRGTPGVAGVDDRLRIVP